MRDTPRRSSSCPLGKVENALEAASTGLSRGTSGILMRFIPSYLEKPKPCCFPLQKEYGYRVRKVVFLSKSFRSQGTEVSPLVTLPYFLILWGEGLCRGHPGHSHMPAGGKRGVQILGMRTDRSHSLLASKKTLCAARTKACGATLQQARDPPPLLESKEKNLTGLYHKWLQYGWLPH